MTSETTGQESGERQNSESSIRQRGHDENSTGLCLLSRTADMLIWNAFAGPLATGAATSPSSQDHSSLRRSASPQRNKSDSFSASQSSHTRREIELADRKRALESATRENNERSRKIEKRMAALETPYHSGASATGAVAERHTQKTKRRAKTETAKLLTTENNSEDSTVVVSCVIRVEWLIGCIILGGFVAYFLSTSASTIPPTSDTTSSPLASLPTTLNPTISPSASPTLPFLFDPPVLQDCRRVRIGEAVLGQDLLTERNFDIVLDVTMRAQVGQIETMELLELEIQKILMPRIIGCEPQETNFLLGNPNRYIVGNGKVKWRPSTLENVECSWTCFSATFNIELFLKTADDQYVVILNLVEEIFGADLFYSLGLESPPFLSVLVRSVINKNPTQAPSSKPTEQTNLPSNLPTILPTSRPTLSPTMTANPTTTSPTLEPTIYLSTPPSIRPSTSSSPSGQKENKGYFQRLDRPIRVACAGDSLTRGRSGGLPADYPYPFQLQEMLGGMFVVNNFGRNAATALRGLSLSYVNMGNFQASLDMEPDIYLLMLGTNDSRYWGDHGQKFRGDMEWIVNKVRSISTESTVRVIVAIPPWVKTDTHGIRNDILVDSVQPEIQTLAIQENLQLVNMYSVTYNQADMFITDGLHLNKNGYRVLAGAWQAAILCNQNGICEAGESCKTCPADCYLNCS